MPQIPVISNQVAPQALPTVRQEYLRDTRGESVGEGLNNLGGVVTQIQRRERDAADTAAVTEAHARLSSWVNEALYTAPDAALKKQGKDAFNLPAQVLPKYQQQANDIGNSLTTPRQKRAFSQAATEFRSQVERQLGQHEAASREQFYDDTDQASRAVSAERAAFNYADPTVVEQSRKDVLATVGNSARRKGWDDAVVAEQSFKALDSFHNTVVDGMLGSGDVSSATKYLNANFPQMSAQTSEGIQRRLLSAETQRVALDERNRKILGDAATKEGDNRLANGGLSADWVEKNRAVLSPEDYRYFYRALSGEGDAPRNPMLYADLRDRAGKGEDVRDEARDALRTAKIRVGDYDRLLNEVEQERPGWYKRGSEYISTMSGVSQLNPDPAAAQTKATMLDQWGDWAKEHSDASDRDAQTAYQDIVSHNMLVQMAGLPLPKYVVGSRLQMDIKSTETATVKALQDGQIDKQEFDRQALLLKKWRQTMQNNQPKATP